MASDEELAASFDRAADLYERARPSYPDAAVDWLLPPDATTVLDLGAGTGKLTRAIVGRGVRCIAVDPSPKMLARLAEALPEVRTLVGSAEEIPLEDAAVDAVLIAQAWHWIDPVRAVPELARVLRPGGSLGVVWNIRDERVDWVRALLEIIGEGGSSEILDTPPDPGPPFVKTERTIVDWSHDLTRDRLVDLVASRSNYIVASDDERNATVNAVDELLTTHPQLRGRSSITMPYRTFCFRSRLR